MYKTQTIDEHLNGNGAVILRASRDTGLNLAVACAIVEKETGGYNIFGGNFFTQLKEKYYPCLAPEFGTQWWRYVPDVPPYLWHAVTPERVKALLASDYFGKVDLGLPQITYYTLIEEAEKMGGAHDTYNQCYVGFKLMKQLLDKHGWENRVYAFASYNGGTYPSDEVIEKYGKDLEAKRRWWKEKFKT